MSIVTKSNQLTQDTLKEYLEYNPVTGEFLRLKLPARSGKLKLGQVAGSINSAGYTNIFIQSICYKAHRLAFLYMEGQIPDYVDHINGIKSDNRWCNLRPATKAENGYNTRVRSDNTSGIKGLCKSGTRYIAQINIEGRHYSKWFAISNFNSEEDTVLAAKTWLDSTRSTFHGEFAKHH